MLSVSITSNVDITCLFMKCQSSFHVHDEEFYNSLLSGSFKMLAVPNLKSIDDKSIVIILMQNDNREYLPQ